MTHAKHRSSIGRRKQPTKGRRHQRGHGPDVIGLAKLILWLINIFVAATICVPAALAFKLQSKALGAAAAAIAIFWVWLYVTQIGLPARKQEAQNKWKAGARALCEQERGLLPDRVLGRSILDETAGMSGRQIIQLLSERGLQFIEVKPALEEGEAPRIALPGRDSPWRLPGLTSPYVRLRLSTTSDPACNPELDHYGSLRMPPFLPDTCLAVEAIEQPTADLAFELEPASSDGLGAYGTRRVVRRETQEVLARLSSCESTWRTFRGSGDLLTRPTEDAGRVHCGEPHRILLDLVFSPDAEWLNHSDRVLKVEKVKARLGLDELLSRADQLPVIAAAHESHTFMSKQELEKVFHPTSGNQGWSEAVAEAREATTRTATYGPRLLDLGRRTLIELALGWPHPWGAHAVSDGFFVVYERSGWDTSARNLLVRFRADGEFEWAVAIAPPLNQSNEPMRWPRAIQAEGANLVLIGWGRAVTREEAARGAESRSARWEIPVERLPAMAPIQRHR